MCDTCGCEVTKSATLCEVCGEDPCTCPPAKTEETTPATESEKTIDEDSFEFDTDGPLEKAEEDEAEEDEDLV